MGGLVVAAGFAWGACTETEYREVIVEVEKPLYEEVPAAAAVFQVRQATAETVVTAATVVMAETEEMLSFMFIL